MFHDDYKIIKIIIIWEEPNVKNAMQNEANTFIKNSFNINI